QHLKSTPPAFYAQQQLAVSNCNEVKEMKPVIGISCSIRARDEEFVHELQDRYVRAVTRAGGIAVALPRLELDEVSAIVRLLDGVIISGGRDIPPDFYGAEPHPTTDTDETMRERAKFEIALVKAMAEADKPVLGICHGCQLLNVAFGGTLIQDIPSQWASPLPHKLPDKPWFTDHEVEIVSGSILWDWLQTPRIIVKSAHHQAVAKVGDGLKVVGWAPDRVVEAIEASDGKIVVGVQWHPEAQLDAEHAQRLFAAFVQACKRK
ncbi:MAG: gamma-glutamyl-gamma-aminobutyrate hydrolase family protein, partial [Armatimonadota bacterium]